MKKFVKDNSLSLTFAALFILALAGHSISGWKFYNEQLSGHQMAPVSYWKYLGTGSFLDSAFTNWQAAVLQLACLIIFSEELYQRGASHSRKPDGDGENQKSGKQHQKESDSKKRKSGQKKRPQHTSWIYRNSLSLAFVAITAATFILHVIFGTMSYNEDRALEHQPPLTIAQFFVSSKFWFLTVQTWQAEFFAILVFIILTIFLRQQGSAESKPTNASDKETGEANK
ncbi:MAG TPA: DUF6766 family protein [Verrucomicrobiae bacterium]|nr:DUF6766 family protein [Verrucomicrobiae bacterium]